MKSPQIDTVRHWERYPQGDNCWAGADWSGHGWRSDHFPATGLYLLEDTHHQLWVVNGELVFKLGGGPGAQITPELRDLIGPWRLAPGQGVATRQGDQA